MYRSCGCAQVLRSDVRFDLRGAGDVRRAGGGSAEGQGVPEQVGTERHGGNDCDQTTVGGWPGFPTSKEEQAMHSGEGRLRRPYPHDILQY